MLNLAELLRLLNNLIRLGTVVEVDHEVARARVQSGDNLTDWLPWLSLRAGSTRDWDPPSTGEQVLLLSPAGDLAQAIVLAGIYSAANPAPASSGSLWRRTFPDGTQLEYDHAAHKLTAAVKGSAELTTDTALTAMVGTDATVTAGGSVSVTAAAAAIVEAPTITLNGPTTVNGPLTIAGPISAVPGAGGASGATFQGSIEVTGGDVTADGISLKGHTHPVSGSSTGAPR